MLIPTWYVVTRVGTNVYVVRHAPLTTFHLPTSDSIVTQLDTEGFLNNGKQLTLRQMIVEVAKTHSEMLLLE